MTNRTTCGVVDDAVVMSVYNPLRKTVHKVVRRIVGRNVDDAVQITVDAAMIAVLYDSVYGDRGGSDEAPDHPRLNEFLKEA